MDFVTTKPSNMDRLQILTLSCRCMGWCRDRWEPMREARVLGGIVAFARTTWQGAEEKAARARAMAKVRQPLHRAGRQAVGWEGRQSLSQGKRKGLLLAVTPKWHVLRVCRLRGRGPWRWQWSASTRAWPTRTAESSSCAR